jgi:hypothetical protein
VCVRDFGDHVSGDAFAPWRVIVSPLRRTVADGKHHLNLGKVASNMKDRLKTVGNVVKTGVRHSITTLSTLGAGAGAGVSSVSESEPVGSVADKLSSAKRRFTQVAMQRMGRTEASEDEEYEALKASLKDMRAQLANLNGHLQGFIGCVRSTCSRSAVP